MAKRKTNSTLDSNGRLKTYSEWSGNTAVVNDTPWTPTGVQLAQPRMDAYRQRNERRTDAWNGVVNLVNDYATGAANAYKSGNYDNKAWDKQYNDIMSYLDEYGTAIGGTRTHMLKAQLKGLHDTLNGTGTQQNMAQTTATAPTSPTQPTIKLPTPQERYQQGLEALNANAWMNGLASPFRPELQRIGRANVTERQTAYDIATGKNISSISDDQLKQLQTRFSRLANTSQNKPVQTTGMDNVRAQNILNSPGFRDLADRTEQFDYMREHTDWTDDQINDYLDNKTFPDTTPKQQNPLLNDNNYQNAVDRINQELSRREFIRKYETYPKASDFAEKSRPNNANGWLGEVPRGNYTDFTSAEAPLTPEEEERMRYSAINGNEAARRYLWGAEDPNSPTGRNSYAAERFMNQDEIDMYNYLYNTQGKDAAEEYFQGLTPTLNRRSTEAYNTDVEVMLTDPGAAVLSNIAGTVIKPFTDIATLGFMTGDILSGKTIDPYDPLYSGSRDLSTIRSKTGERIKEAAGGEGTFLGDLAGLGYEATTSMIDNLYGITLGSGVANAFGLSGKMADPVREAVTLSIMGTSSAQSSVLENIEAGIPQTRAIIMGAASGIIEVLTEKIGLDNLFNSVWQGEEVFKSLAKQMLSEGSEELVGAAVNDALDLAYDALTGQNYSDIRRQMNDYIVANTPEGAEHLNPRLEGEALGHVINSKIKEYGTAALTGALSGGMMGAGFAGAGSFGNHTSIRNDLGIDSRNADVVNALIEEGKAHPQYSGAYKQATALENRIASGSRATQSQVNRLYNELRNGRTVAARNTEADNAEPNAQDYVDATLPARSQLTASRIVNNAWSTNPSERLTRTSFVNDIANGYRSAGRTAMATTVQQMYVPGMEASNYVSEMGAVYSASLEGRALPDTPHLTDAMVEATVNAAKADVIRNVPQTLKQNIVNDSLNAETQSVYVDSVRASVEEGHTQGEAQEAFEAVYNAAFTGKDVDTAKASALPTEVQNRIIETARQDAQTYTQELTRQGFVKVAQPGTTYTDQDTGVIATVAAARAFKNGTELQKKTITTMNTFAKDLGVRINLIDNGKKLNINGNYINDAATINIALDTIFKKGVGVDAAVMGTFGHEMTHRLQRMSPSAYSKLVEAVRNEFESKNWSNLIRHQMEIQPGISYENAVDEVVANFVGERFAEDSSYADRLLGAIEQTTDTDTRSAIQKLRDFVRKVIDWIRGHRDELDNADEQIRRYEAVEQALTDLYESAKQKAEGAKTISLEASQDLAKVNTTYDTATESVHPSDGTRNSIRTWDASDYVQARNEAAKEMAEALGISVKKAKAYIDTINGVAKYIADNETRLDYVESTGGSAFVGNVEYGGSFDFTTMCQKARLFMGTFTAVQRALGNNALTANEVLELRDMMKKKGYEVTCGCCYVEGSRANEGGFALKFMELYEAYFPDNWQPDLADLVTPEGIEWVRMNHHDCYEQYNKFWNDHGRLREGDPNLFASQQKPKMYQSRTAYNGEILNNFKKATTIEQKNRNGGIRMQSFSDFEIVHLIDCMQTLMDMSRVGLAGQAFTKVYNFADAFGNTGLKINLSLIAKGVDADGNIEIDPVEGMKKEDAIKLRNKYSDNVGTIIVCFNDEQVLAAMKSDFIDFIIPFHRSQWKKAQYGLLGLPEKVKDYTNQQNEKLIRPTYHEFRGRMVKDKATNFMPNNYWDFNLSGKENAERYLQLCAQNNKRPKFYKFLDKHADGSYSLKADGSTDGYWKLLIDFKMYNNEGVGVPQMPVRPDFSMDEINRMLSSYEGGHAVFPAARDVADAFVEQYKENHPDRDYSTGDVRNSVRDEEYMTAVNSGDMATAQRMVDVEAKMAGYGSPKLYHGTRKFGFTVFDLDFMDDNRSIFVTNDPRTAGTYSGSEETRNIKDAIRNWRTASDAQIIKAMNASSDFWMHDFRVATPEEANSKIKDQTARFKEYVDEFNNIIRNYESDSQIEYIENLRDILEKASTSTNAEQLAELSRQFVELVNEMRGLGFLYTQIDQIVGSHVGGYFGIAEELQKAGERIASKRMYISNSEPQLFYSWNEVVHDLEISNNVNRGIYSLYGKTENMFEFDNNYSAWNNIESERVDAEYFGEGNLLTTRDVAMYAQENGYDGVIIHNIFDNGGRTDYDEASDVYIYFDSSSLKSADPVTYDNNGDVIPLNERFVDENPDIRYSVRENTITIGYGKYSQEYQADDITKEFASQMNANAGKLAMADTRNEILGYVREFYKQFQKGVANESNFFVSTIAEFEPVAKRPASKPDYISYTRDGKISSEYWYSEEGVIRGSKHWGVGVASCDWFLGKQTPNMKGYKQYGYAKWSDFVQKTRIITDGNQAAISTFENTLGREDYQINPTSGQTRFSVREEVEDTSPLTEIHRQRNKTRVVLDVASEWRRNLTKLDTKKLRAGTEKIIQSYADILSPEQTNKIVSKVNKLASEILTNKSMQYGDIQTRAEEIASDIVFQTMKQYDPIVLRDLEQNRTAATAVDSIANLVMSNIVTTQTQQTSSAMREVQRQIERNDKLKDTLREVRQKRDQAMRERIDADKERRAKRAESKERKHLLDVMKRLNTLAKRSTADQRAEINSIIGEYDLTCQRLTEGKVQKLEDLSRWVQERMQQDPLGFAPNPNVLKAIDNLTKKHIADLSLSEVRDITRALMNIENEIREGKHTLETQDRRDINAQGQDVIDGILNSRDKAVKHEKSIEGLMLEVMRPETFFRRLVGFDDNNPLYKLTFGNDMSLATGQRTMIDYQRRANENYFRNFLDDKEFSRSIVGKNARAIEIKGIDENGNQVKLKVTPDLLMSLYMHAQNEQNLKHIVNMENRVKKDGVWTTEIDHAGGMTVPNFDLYREGKIEEAYRKGTKIVMNKADIARIVSQLKPKEMGFIHACQRYYTEMSQPEINRVSEALNGYSIATVDNYYHIPTDKNYRPANMEGVRFDAKIESQGWTNERQNASNPILLYGIIDQLQRDIDGHSKYVGLAIPIRNFEKIVGVNRFLYNDKGDLEVAYQSSVQKAINKMYGSGAWKYIDKLMGDIQMPKGTKDFFGRFLAKVRSHYAGAVLTINAGVAIKQAASYPTAAAEIGWTPLIRAFTNTSLIRSNKLNMDLVYRYSPLMRLRTEGISTQELGEMKDQGRSIPKLLNWIQGMDVATVKKLWKASEYYVRANFKDIARGTEAYYKKVGEVHSKVIERTQPNYSALQRPQILRTDNELVKTLNMFKTQPFQNLNILLESFGELKATQRAAKINPTADNKAKLATARKRVAWAVSSQVVSALVFSLMQFAWDFARKKDEKYRNEDGELSFEAAAKRIAINSGSSVAGMIPFGSVIFEGIQTATDKIAKTIDPEAEPIFDAVFYGIDAGTATDSINESIKGIVNVLGRMVSVTKDIFYSIQNGTEFDWDNYVRDTVRDAEEVAAFAGIPAENTEKILTAMAKWILGATMGDAIGNYYTTLVVDGVKSSNKKSLITNLMRVREKDPEQFDELYDLMIQNEDFGTSSQTAQEYIDKKIESYEKEHTANGYTYEGQAVYDQVTSDLFSSPEWQRLSETEQQALVALADDFVNKNNAQWNRGKEGIEAGVFDSTEYLMFMNELNKANEANTEGSSKSYDKKEQLAAIEAMGWTDAEAKRYWQYLPKGDTQNPWDEEKKESSSTKKSKTTTEKDKTTTDTTTDIPTIELTAMTEPETKATKKTATAAKTDSDYVPYAERQAKKEKEEAERKAKMVHETVDTASYSSWIGSVSYDEETQTLSIMTKRGQPYTRTGVSKELYEEMKRDPGRTWNAYFR